jgi:hypothetical protein
MYYYYCYHYGHTHDARIGKVTMFSGAFGCHGCHGRLRARFSDDPQVAVDVSEKKIRVFCDQQLPSGYD